VPVSVRWGDFPQVYFATIAGMFLSRRMHVSLSEDALGGTPGGTGSDRSVEGLHLEVQLREAGLYLDETRGVPD